MVSIHTCKLDMSFIISKSITECSLLLLVEDDTVDSRWPLQLSTLPGNATSTPFSTNTKGGGGSRSPESLDLDLGLT